jgi:hypothetical protein
MKFSGVQEIKKELQLLSPKKLQEICLRLAKYKKDNKELLAFLLFESDDKRVFIDEVKSDFNEELTQLEKQNNLFYTKKSLRRLLRLLNRYLKYIDDKAISLELIIWFCQQLKEHQIPMHRSRQLENIYEGLLKKIAVLLKTVHEDLRQDYEAELANLR